MNARLLVLGLLRDRPQHGYELHKWLETSRTDLWADVLPGSIYHALRQMEKEGFVEVQSVERTGHRSRAVYAITAAGQMEFDHLLRKGWQHPPSSLPASFYTLLTFSDQMPAAVIRDAIQQHITALEHKLVLWQEGEPAKLQAAALPPWGPALFQNGRAHLEADISLLRTLLETWD